MARCKDWKGVAHRYVKIDKVCDEVEGYPKEIDGCKFPREYDGAVGDDFWEELAAYIKSK